MYTYGRVVAAQGRADECWHTSNLSDHSHDDDDGDDHDDHHGLPTYLRQVETCHDNQGWECDI